AGSGRIEQRAAHATARASDGDADRAHLGAFVGEGWFGGAAGAGVAGAGVAGAGAAAAGAACAVAGAGFTSPVTESRRSLSKNTENLLRSTTLPRTSVLKK